MTSEKFEELFERIGPVIQKEKYLYASGFTPRTKLEITLQFLATGFLKILITEYCSIS